MRCGRSVHVAGRRVLCSLVLLCSTFGWTVAVLAGDLPASETVSTAPAAGDGSHPLRVVRADAAEVVLDRGADSAVQVGSRLECFTTSEDIVDPETGAVLGHYERAVGSLFVTSVQPARCIAEPGDGHVPVRAVCRLTGASTPSPHRTAARPAAVERARQHPVDPAAGRRQAAGGTGAALPGAPP